MARPMCRTEPFTWKNFSSDLKKALRVKGAPAPKLEVEVAFPSVKLIELSGNTILHRSDVLYAEEFTLNASDKARVDKIYVDCNTAEINLAKNAYADVEVKADEMLYVVTSNLEIKDVCDKYGKFVRISEVEL